MSETKRCPQCQAEIPAAAPEALCPACLLQAGLDPKTADAEVKTAPFSPSGPGFVPPTPEALQLAFPQLEILELLGKGGMGAVYKALALLFDLTRGIQDPPQPAGKPGRKPISMRDMVFACGLKVFTTFSSRRFACDLEDAYEKGFLSQMMHSVRVCAYLEDPLLAPVLEGLIVRSSLPLKSIETTFIPDSTGFSTSRFVRWHDEKYGTMRSGKAWVKAHAICGAITNIVTAVEIGGQYDNDSPKFKPLVETTAKNFNMQSVPADKAYLSHENLAQVDKLGGTAWVPFKSNSLQGEAGSLWEKMYLFYNYRREEFLKKYHQRSNIESTFSMVKAKFRDHVRSKTDVAMKNEVLTKFLCHNIVVVHQSQIELGIEAEFWKDEKEGARDVLPMVPA